MILCICNALSEGKIRAIVDRGVGSPEEAFSALDCEARCCTCVPEIEAMISAPIQAAVA